ncbi:MAG: hypothetical protein HKN01_01500 [Acidimicrobiia bacterium]|nr:hypothetical protein [Acidimicrobiia bacterium]
MGLLDSYPIFQADTEVLCRTALILEGITALPDGAVVDDGDRERLAEARAQGMGAPTLTSLLRKLGFEIGQSNVTEHLAGRCLCGPDVTLRGSSD